MAARADLARTDAPSADLGAAARHGIADEQPLDELYVALEDRFRGTRDDITQRLRAYLPIVKAIDVRPDDQLCDLGCGRGEWLELLREHGWNGQGVDGNRVMIERCRALNLDVVHSDAIDFLRRVPRASVALLSAFHLAEHLSFPTLVALFDEAARVLRRDGALLIETPNPAYPRVATHDFYLDPTHRHPLPALLLRFLAETKGFDRIEILPAESEEPGPDYALIARETLIVRIAIATTHVPFVRGGAELLAEDLAAALKTAGHHTDIIRVPFKWYPPETLLDHMVAARLLDLSASAGAAIDRVIALKFPAYLIPHPQKVLWLLHQHHGAYERWNHPLDDMRLHPLGPQVRAAIQHADTTILAEVRARFAISATVAARLQRFCGLEAQVLYPPPPGANALFCAEAADYVFFPSRLAPIKRQSLVIDALAQTQHPVRVAFAGGADDPAYGSELHARARTRGVGDRVEWLGVIDESEKRRRYAHCVAVVFPPSDEDFGFVTLEAMASSKPVVTCTDSGGPAELIAHQQNGLVVEPTPNELAAALDLVWRERGRARDWGAAARARYEQLDLSWSAVVQRLLA